MSEQQQKELPSKKKPRVSERLDGDGNMVIATDDGAEIKLELKLKSETRIRKLGYIDKARRYFFVERSREDHLFRKNESYGFNYGILEQAQTFDYVCLFERDNTGAWKIPLSFIMDKKNHNVLYFQGKGFERQVFIEIKTMEPFRRSPIF